MIQAPAQPQAALHDIISVEALAALAIAALIASAISLVVGSLTRRLLLAIEGDRFHKQPIAQATVTAVRRVTFVLSLLVLAFPALDLAGVKVAVGLHPEEVTRWLTESGARKLEAAIPLWRKAQAKLARAVSPPLSRRLARETAELGG